MGSRTKARARVLQVLYAWDVRGGLESLRQVDAELTRPGARPLKPEVRSYTDRLLAVIADNRREIDGRIEGLAENWRLSRMTVVDRNILRLAAAEMLHLPEIPLRVSLQEAILLAEWFGTDESRRFVNGVLDALLRELQPEQVSDSR
ncbi:MAG: transcription antitermination factor NusB [Gemmatimonadetes bacterium]|uniref:Transcription antitermination protein NusB n=1 Tax=Candidatus Kutchimonas denitrificans TaxID=3056748 RepID=A0AAE5CCC1_9BACT|nr:transcription antitermination factor NusB [Gemmatimonadota bacterium]NIR75693.1 transcription antitermination factor NusB [Candidatus Kutchimonas denitrificans]NIS00306.1 transcription antitermination factor NusB [Gemmatimonadota bacterium]NIT65965.1 transcription antitermination factor NusB [Gemmatimonadota bacterium]NIU53669.1 transcription antitermination factor NusB [Gemmatimonadota bacterium]